jgi:hypothetical protein
MTSFHFLSGFPGCKTRLRRSRTGQAMVEGVVALSMIVAVTVAAVLLMINVGLCLYYKQKICFAAQQAAALAARQYAWGGYRRANLNVVALQNQTNALVDRTLQQMGVIAAGSTARPTTTINDAGVTINLRPSGLTILGKTGVFPTVVSLRESVFTPITECAAPVLLEIRWPNNICQTGSANAVMVPAYGLQPPNGGISSLGTNIVRSAWPAQIPHLIMTLSGPGGGSPNIITNCPGGVNSAALIYQP